MTVGDRIRKARKAKGYTQEELAKLLGVSFAMIGQYERGERNPKIETLQRIADALGVGIGVLMYGTDSTFTDLDGVKYSGKIIPQSEIDNDDVFEYRISKLDNPDGFRIENSKGQSFDELLESGSTDEARKLLENLEDVVKTLLMQVDNKDETGEDEQ